MVFKQFVLATAISSILLAGCETESTPVPAAPKPDAAAVPSADTPRDAAEASEDAAHHADGGHSDPVLAGGCEDRGYALDALQLGDARGLRVRVLEATPGVPFVGNNSWRVALWLAGEPLVGSAAQLEAVPFMPDHGHGTAVAVGIEEQEPGTYLLAPINLRMPGYWETTLTLTTDAGARSVMIPVCVE